MKIEKKFSFHVSFTFIAQNLVVTAQIDKKWILSLLSVSANSLMFISVFLIIKTLLKKYLKKIQFGESGSKVSQKCANVEC